MADNVFRTDPYTAAMGGNQPTPAAPERPPLDPKIEIERLASQSRVPANILMAMTEHVGAKDPDTAIAVAARVADQLAPRMAGGESVDSVITGAFRDPEHAKVVLLRARALQQELYPDFDPFEGEGMGRLAARRGQQAAKGATEVVASIPEAAAIQAEQMEDNVRGAPERMRAGVERRIAMLEEDIADPDTPEPVRARLREQIEADKAMLRDIGVAETTLAANPDQTPTAADRSLYGKGDAIREASADVFGAPDPRDQSFWAAVAEGGGNMTAFAVTALLSPDRGTASVATLGAAMNKSQLYKEAIDAGATEEVAQRASQWGSLIGASEIIPIGRALNLLPPRLRSRVGNGVMKKFADVAQGAGEEAAQEYLATVANNIVASGLYDPERGWTDGATEAALVGAVLGGTLGGLGTVLERDDRARAVAAPTPPEAPAPQPSEDETPVIEGDERAPVPTRSKEEPVGGESVRPSTGPIGRAADNAPAPIADGLEAGAPVDVTAGPTNVKGTFVRETPGAVVVKDEEGNELEIPREEFDKGEVTIAPRTAEETEAPPRDGGKAEDYVMVYDDSADVPDIPEITGNAETEGERPGRLVPMAEKDVPPRTKVSLEEEYASLDPEEAQRRAKIIEDLAKSTGWDKRLKDRHDILVSIAEKQSEPEAETEAVVDERDTLDPPDDLKAAPLPVRKRDGSPFSNEATARRAVKNRKLDPDTYDYQEMDGGVVAVPKSDIMATPKPEKKLAASPKDEAANQPANTKGSSPKAGNETSVAENSPQVEKKADPEGPAQVIEAVNRTDASSEEQAGSLTDPDVPDTSKAVNGENSTPRAPTRPMRDPDDRIQPDMLGGPSETETQVASRERTAREWGQFLGIAERGTPSWDGEIEGHAVSVRGSQVQITNSETGKVSVADVDGMSRTDIARWARGAVPKQVVSRETPSRATQADLSATDAPQNEPSNPNTRGTSRAKSTEVHDSPGGPRVIVNSVGPDGKTDNERGRPYDKALDAAAAETDRNPSEAQKEAENYKTGKIQWNGLTLSIENAKGSTRSKKTPDGKTQWSVKMPAHYGRILKTEGADGDHVDFYMGDNPEAPLVWVVDQVDEKSGVFDEHKLMLGFDSRAEAEAVYKRGFSDGKGADRMGAATEIEIIDLKQWLKGDTTKPMALKLGGTQGRKSLSSLSQEKQDRAALLRARIKERLTTQINSGFDPMLVKDATELAALYIEDGIKRFRDLLGRVAADMGMTAKDAEPWLRTAYNNARDEAELAGQDVSDMDDSRQVLEVSKEIRAADPSMFTKGSQPAIEKTPQEAEANDNASDGSDGRTGPAESTPDPEAGQEGSGEVRAADRGEGGSRDSGAERAGERSEPRRDGARGRAQERNQRSDDRPKPRNHVIDTGGLTLARGEKTRARESIEAIRTLRTLEAEGRPATEEERATLAKYGGAGTLAGALPRSDGTIKHEDLAGDLKELLTDEEMATLSRTSQYAFYTAEPVVRAMWSLASRLGADVPKARVFEPGMGVGNFPGTMPKQFRDASYRGIELDHITAGIAKALYPNHKIERGDFIETKLPQGFYDLVIGNPPFAGTKIQADRDYPQRFMIHDYFFAKSLDAVRPGGLLMFVTSAGTMNKQDSAARDYLADRADLVGAIRLPNTAFKENGTDVTTDIVVLRKRLEGETEANPAWREAVKTDLVDLEGKTGQAFVNRYFLDNPNMILGEQGLFDTLTAGPRVGVRAKDDGRTLEQNLAKAWGEFPKSVVSAQSPEVRMDALNAEHTEKKAGSFYLQGDDLYQFDGTLGQKVERRSKQNTKGMPKAAMETVQALIPIRDALRDVYAADIAGNDAEAARKRLNDVYDAFVAKRGPIGLQQRTERRPSVVEQEAARQRAYEDARNDGQSFDQGSFDPSAMFNEGATTAQIARARAEARKQPGYREGDFNPDDMPSKVLVKRPNIDAFMDDPESFRLLAIEKYDEKTDTAEKSRVFTENAVKLSLEPKINSPEDALLHTMAETGKVDIDRIAELAGSDPRTVREELGDKVFLNPATKEFETAAKYLSGNVRAKLREAQDAALKDPSLSINVTSLEEVQPDMIPSNDIRVPIGAHWFESAIYAEFAQSLGLDLRVGFQPSLGIWTVDGSTGSAAATNEYGTADYPFATLMRTMMNNKKIEVRRTPKGKPSYVDEEATQAATDKAIELQEKWSEWLWSDDDRRGDLEALYNETFNAEVAPSYDGAYLTTPGIHSDWSWRPHQTAVIARILQSGNTYMAHTVGAGKTSAMIGAGMESRRLGIAKKPMYVVPNHMLVQFTTEFYQQYPLAKILVADDKRFHTSRRKQFVADAALGDWDAIIITHSGFEKIPASEAARMAAVEAMISDMRDVIDNTKEGDDISVERSILGALGSVASIAGLDVKSITDGEKKTRKKIEALIEAAEQRVKRQTSTDNKDQVFDFDELGVDQLFVDEAHLFRKLSFATTNGNIKGIDPAGSQKSMDLYVKSQALEKRNPGRSLVFASGTPITNTMAELYSISRYLQPQALDERGIGAFDSWAATFGTTSSDLEQTPDGSYKQVARFAKFVNTPELSLMVRQVMDVVSSSDLDQYVTRPKLKGGSRQLIVVPASQEVKDFQKQLGARMTAIQNRKGPVSKGDDILLSVIGDGRLSAIDMRLVAGVHETNAAPSSTGEGSKLERMIDEVYARWKTGAKVPLHGVKPEGGYTDKPIEHGPSTQIVFSTLGISGTKHNERFGVHRFIKAQLVARGVPAKDIVVAEDLKTDTLKQRAFNDMNEGKKRILIGSKNLFTGVNAQRRIIAVHNADPLWYPADDEQRNGRALRQGNMNPEIEILDYTTKGTYDATMWQMMARKAAFIEAFYRGDPSVREIEDMGEASAYDQAKAMSTADPRVLRLTEMKAEADVLNRRRRAAETQERRLRSTVEVSSRFLKDERARLSPWKDASSRVENLKGDAFRAMVGSTEYDSRKDFGNALIQAADGILASEESVGNDVKVGSISGFDITAWGSKAAQEVYFEVVAFGKETFDAGWSDDPVGLARKVETALSRIADMPARIEERLATTENKIAEAKDQVGKLKGFEQVDELVALEDKIADLEAELLADAKDDKELRSPEGWGEAETAPEAEPELTDAEMRDLTQAVKSEMKAVGLADRVPAKVVRSMAEYGKPDSVRGVYKAGGEIGVKAGPNAMGTLHHEIVHALRDKGLWGRQYGLFTEAEWKGLVRAARADKALMKDIKERYGHLPVSGQLEEAVAEQYRMWQAKGGSNSAFEKMANFFKAIGNALRGRGFQTRGRTFEAIASGKVGRRSASVPQVSDTTGPDREMRGATALADVGQTKESERKRIGQMLTNAMQGDVSLLSLVPGRALFSELGAKLPAAQTYLKLKENMDSLRNDWHAKTDSVAQDWRKLIRKSGDNNNALMDLMHETTLTGVDPSEDFSPKSGPEDQDILRNAKPDSYAYQNAERRIEEDKARRKRHGSLKAKFDALPAEYQEMYRRVRDQYDEMATAFEEAVIKNAKKSMQVGLDRAKRRHKEELDRIRDEGLTGQEKDDAIKEADRRLTDAKRRNGWNKNARLSALRASFESNRLDGPYFPLARFGRFFVTARDKQTGKVVSFSRFENERAQQSEAARLRKQPEYEIEVGVIDEKMNWKDQVDPNFVADVEEMLGAELGKDGADVMDMVWQRWLETLPDFSVRKSRIHRKGTAGYDGDAFRAFGRQMFHGSHQLARLEYALDMQNALEEARLEAGRSNDPNRAGLVVTEMEKRHEFTMNPTGGKLAQTATSAAFVWYLSITPSAALVNLSQTTVVGIPVIRAGLPKTSVGQVSRALMKALKDFASGRGEAERAKSMTDDERAAMREAYKRGTIDKTQSHDLAGVAETGVEYSDVRVRWMGKISWFFHHAERLNREVTFLASYRLARSSGMDHTTAINKAADLTWKSHFDYQNTSRPRLMQSDTAKVLLVFRNFNINMLWRLFRDTHQALKGETPEARREARSQIFGISMMMMAQAGVTGIWGYSLVTAIAALATGMERDEVEEEVKRSVVTLFGPEVGGAVLKGVPGHVTGTDLTARIGMPDLWFRSSDRLIEGQDAYNYWLAETAGASVGILEGLYVGGGRVKDGLSEEGLSTFEPGGRGYRGIETMAPKFVRDIMQATRFYVDGVNTYNGDPILENVDARTILIEALGFTPAQLSERYETNTRMKNKEKRIQDRRKGIHRRATEEIREGKPLSKETLEMINEFNADHPNYPVNAASIRRSLQGRLRASARNEFGVQLNNKLNAQIRESMAPGVYN